MDYEIKSIQCSNCSEQLNYREPYETHGELRVRCRKCSHVNYAPSNLPVCDSCGATADLPNIYMEGAGRSTVWCNCCNKPLIPRSGVNGW